MPILIGTDEAGYGPNLGPLVITATSWTVPDDFDAADFWSCVADVVSNESPTAERLHVADSKLVYSSSRSIEPLELSALAFLSLFQGPLETNLHLGAMIAGEQFNIAYADEPWNDQGPFELPVAVRRDQVDSFRERLQNCLDAHAIRLNAIHSRILFPAEFNALVNDAGSKGVVLSAATLALVRQCTDSFAGELCGSVICDKHGGRNRYDDVIAQAFDDQFVFRLHESRPASRYRVGSLEFCFRTRAEELLPVALASIVSKYVREVLMLQFNRFWQGRVPELRATKGYPGDAKRFWLDIADTVTQLNIDRCRLWRHR